MKIHDIPADPGKRQKRKRLGRGHGSGTGTYAGKGLKGQKARAGVSLYASGFEGGQTRIQMRMPKRGFNNPFKVTYSVVNVQDLERFDDKSIVDPDALKSSGLVKGKKFKIKVLGSGTLSKNLTVKAHVFSKSATDKISAAGGSCEVIR